MPDHVGSITKIEQPKVTYADGQVTIHFPLREPFTLRDQNTTLHLLLKLNEAYMNAWSVL